MRKADTCSYICQEHFLAFGPSNFKSKHIFEGKRAPQIKKIDSAEKFKTKVAANDPNKSRKTKEVCVRVYCIHNSLAD